MLTHLCHHPLALHLGLPDTRLLLEILTLEQMTLKMPLALTSFALFPDLLAQKGRNVKKKPHQPLLSPLEDLQHVLLWLIF